MSGRGDRGRGRAGQGGRGGDTRGSSPSQQGSRGSSPARGQRGAYTPPRGGSGFRGGGPGPSRGGAPAAQGPPPPPVPAPAQGPAVQDQRIATMQPAMTRFQAVAKSQKDPKHPLRPGFGTLGTAILVRANFFALKFPKGLIIHDYEIAITPKTDIARLKGRIIESMEQHPDFAKFRAFVAHDKSQRLICCRALPQPLKFDIPLIEEGETTPRNNAKSYNVELKKTGELNTEDLTKYTDGDPDNKDLDTGRLVSALNLVVQAGSGRTGTRVGKNRYFFGPAQRPLGDGIEAWRGYFASVRPVWKTMMVNVNVCMTAFIEQKNMADAIMDFQRGSRGAVPNISKMFQKSNLKVRTKHLGYTKVIKAISDKTAKSHRFECAELGGVVTVEEYFRKKYPNMPLRHPDLPLLVFGNDPKKQTYIPAELCDIVKGIPFRGRLNDRQTSDMLRLACQTPQTNSELIRGDGFAKLAISESTKHDVVKNFGITIDQNMTVVPARILPPPGLTYAQGRAQVRDGSWNILDVKFHRPGLMDQWAVLIVRDGRDKFQGPGDPAMWAFIQGFAEKCRKAGMRVAQQRPTVAAVGPLPPGSDRDPSRSAAVAMIKQQITTLASANPRPTFILVLLNNRDNYIYPGIKRIGDVELGIHTVCMQLDKAIGDPRKQDQYFSNVALKVNTKLGGINHKLDVNNLRWLHEKKTMVVGADVTHPGPTSIDGTPSLAAVVASVDSDFVQFPASMRLQESKEEMIQDFTAMMVERLLLYQTRSKALPERVFLFRDGVSEGQYDKVLTDELPQIQKAFEKVYTGKDGKPSKKPDLMICICGKRHHARFFPTDDQNATRNGNTKPGTIVDKGVGEVYRFDFYLQAHAGLQGTVKATHYVVIYDEIGLTADAIQQGTHTSSYAYVRATKAVSLIPAAYYADLACERGRLYLNDFLNLGGDKGSVAGSGRGRMDRDAAKKQVFDDCVKAWGEGIHERVRNSMFYV